MTKSSSKAQAAKVAAKVKAGTPAKPKDVALSPEVRAEIVARVGEAKAKGAEARFVMAQATALVLEHRAIGEGRIYPTQADYAAALGVSASAVSGLKVLAVAVGKGLTPDHTSWGVISSKAGNLGAVAKDPKVTLAALTRAAKAAKAKDEAAAKAKAGKASDPRATAAEKTAKADAAKAKADGGVYAEVQEALRVIRAARKAGSLSPAQVRATRNTLATLLAEYGGTQEGETKVSA